MGIDQLTVALCRLTPSSFPGALKPPTTETVRELYENPNTDPADGHEALYRLHVQTLQTLTATDFRLGKAYSLGRALADSVFLPDEPHGFAESFDRFRLDVLRAWLNDLDSALPPHAAGAVLQSLTRWEAWAPNFVAARQANRFGAGERRELTVILRRQAELWRAVLSGEKNALDMLNGDDYRRAAGTLLSTARSALLRTSLPVGAVAVVVTAVVIGAVLSFVKDGTTQAVASLGAAAGALGITWKSASATLQRAAKTLEAPLWGAAMNAAIAEAVTYLPPADAFRGRLLGHTPLCLRAVDGLGENRLPELIETLRGSPARGTLTPRDALELRWWNIQGRAPSEDEIHYWLTWAAAAGYLTADGSALTEEGRRLARIPRRDQDAARAALSAARPSAQHPSRPQPDRA